MKTADFDYDLPPSLIAQTPIEPRDASRLLVLRRAEGTLEHRHFRDLPDFLRAGDVLVANDSRVMPARLYGRKRDTGGRVELLLIARQVADGSGVSDRDQVWAALVRPGRRVQDGACIELENPGVEARGLERDERGDVRTLCCHVIGRTPWGGRLVRFEGADDLGAAIEALGRVPLPPYILAPLADDERYQTVYANAKGSAAAPTAGLHFTPQLMARLRERGVQFAFVTLHIGLDTFRPVQAEELSAHTMHSEFAELTPETATLLGETRREGRRIIAVGTTAVRVLESATGEDGQISPFRGWTRLFIYPGYRFKAVDALITNFHLPRSSLVMLVSAFAGREVVLRAYEQAARLSYRFYSFGDAMLAL